MFVFLFCENSLSKAVFKHFLHFYEISEGSAALGQIYHVDSSQGGLSIGETNQSAPGLSEAPAPKTIDFSQADVASFQLMDEQGRVSIFNIVFDIKSL